MGSSKSRKASLKARVLPLVVILIVMEVLSLMYSAPALAQNKSLTPKKRNVQTHRYVINQTFKGQSFFKDNNVWVYNQKFADTFGMPPEDIYPELKGIEAAAFRIEDTNYKTCGMGGKAENCMDDYRCVTDIYIDETKNPLPWATDQQADWLNEYNSLLWLRLPSAPKTPEEKVIDRENNRILYKPPQGGRGTQVPAGVMPNLVVNLGTFTLRPFADPVTHKEANYFQNADMPGNSDLDYNLVTIYGYKRAVIAGLTMITLRYHYSNRNEKKQVVTFRLESREEIFSPTLKRFHEFQLPKVFGDKIESQLQARTARDVEYYKKLLNFK